MPEPGPTLSGPLEPDPTLQGAPETELPGLSEPELSVKPRRVFFGDLHQYDWLQLRHSDWCLRYLMATCIDVNPLLLVTSLSGLIPGFKIFVMYVLLTAEQQSRIFNNNIPG